MIDHRMFNVKALVNLLLKKGPFQDSDNWKHQATILPIDNGYTVCLSTWALRWSKGPVQGYFWDFYGDHFLTPEQALMGLYHAPPIPRMIGLYLTELEQIRNGKGK